MCYRLYAIRLVEIRSHSLENKRELLESLSRLLEMANDVCAMIERVGEREKQTSRHELSKSYLDEMLTTLPQDKTKIMSLQQHAVYTLHERYARHVELTTSLRRVRDLLDEKIETFETISMSHANSIRFIKSYDF